MSTDATVTDATTTAAADHHDDHAEHKPDSYYVKVAAMLAVITALEVAWSYIDVGPFFLPGLLLMMVVKFIAVVSIFMHLKFDKKVFSWSFYTGLILAIGVYIVMALAFQAFGG